MMLTTMMLMVSLSPASGLAEADGAAPGLDDCRVEPSVGHDLRMWIGCDADDCGILANTACWSVRFGCHMAGGALAGPFDDYECQDANQSDGLALAGSTGLPLPLLGDGCDNYGVLVNVLSSRCPAEDCENHGVLVNIASDYCGYEDDDVCLGERCASEMTRPLGPGLRMVWEVTGQHVD